MRFTAAYVKTGHPATFKEIEAGTDTEALRKARRECPSDRKLGHITSNHVGNVIWDTEKRQKKKLQKK